MSEVVRQVANPPPKPLMVYDGDCRFCTAWIRRWQQITGDAIDYLPSRDEQVARRFPEIPREQFETSVQLIEASGQVFTGAKAVFQSMARNPKWLWPLRWYERSRFFRAFTEWSYRLVARHRSFFSWISGTHP